jgi:hypothetical protein
MSYQVSPGIEVNEIDNTSTVSGLNSTAAAHVGLFNWGPVLQPTTVTSELNLKELFWKPTDSNAQSWFTAANFLAYSNNLINIRVDAAAQYTAVKTPKALLAGTTHFTTGSTAVFGFNGTQFSTLTVGQNLIDADYNIIGSVASITNNTQLTLNAVPTTTSIPYLTGIITASTGSAAVVGTGTLFTTELAVGDIVTKLSASSAGYDILGTILSIADDTHITLAANSAVVAAGVAFGVASTLTGTITSTTGTATVTGVGTNFAEVLAIGDVLTTPARVIIGTIASIASNTSLSLTANGAVAVTGSAYAKGTQTFKDNRVKINNYDDYEANYIEETITNNGYEDIITQVFNMTEFSSINSEFKNGNNIIAHPSVCFSRKFWDDNKNRYNKNEIPEEDFKLWKESINNGYSFGITEEFLLFYRIHNKQISKRRLEDVY